MALPIHWELAGQYRLADNSLLIQEVSADAREDGQSIGLRILLLVIGLSLGFNSVAHAGSSSDCKVLATGRGEIVRQDCRYSVVSAEVAATICIRG